MQKKRENFRQAQRRNDLERKFKQKREMPNIVTIGDYCYNSENRLGKGSYCEVFSGWHSSNKNKKVAIRVLQANSRVLEEIRLQRSLKSKNIAKIYDYYEEEGKIYLIMELCEEPLSKCYLEFSRSEAILHFQQILNGVEELQKHRIIHRDLKLDNILIKRNQIKIIDFGFAKTLTELGTDSVKCGTPETMAPEVHKSDKRCHYSDKQDVWALGIILHQLFYKDHPFQNLECLQANKRKQVYEEDEIINDFIDKCLQPDENERISLKEALQHRVRKYEILDDESKTLFKSLKQCVYEKLESITHYCKETIKGYFK